MENYKIELNIVLVRSKYASNIGAVARAMSNMGADRLILVDVQCELDANARQGAAGAQQKLRNITKYKAWKDFYALEVSGVRIAFTRRGGRNRSTVDFKTYLTSVTQDQKISLLENSIYLIFGPEDHGLARGDMEFVHGFCTLPIYGDFFSLNLSQAAMLALYIYQSEMGIKDLQSEKKIEGKGFTGKNRVSHFPEATIKKWIEAIGFDLSARRSSAYLTVKRLFLESLPTDRELHVLESILQQNIRILTQQKSEAKKKQYLPDVDVDL